MAAYRVADAAKCGADAAVLPACCPCLVHLSIVFCLRLELMLLALEGLVHGCRR